MDFCVGSKQGGIAEAVVQSINLAPEEFRSLLFANIILVGGNLNIPGFQERLQREVRTMAPSNYLVRIIVPTKYTPALSTHVSPPWALSLLSPAFSPLPAPTHPPFLTSSPVTCAWEGAAALVSDKKSYATKLVTRKEYMEYGSSICSTKFDTPKAIQEGSGRDAMDEQEMY